VIVIEHIWEGDHKTRDGSSTSSREVGDGGGPERRRWQAGDVVKVKRSYTGAFLKPVLAKARTVRARGPRRKRRVSVGHTALHKVHQPSLTGTCETALAPQLRNSFVHWGDCQLDPKLNAANFLRPLRVWDISRQLALLPCLVTADEQMTADRVCLTACPARIARRIGSVSFSTAIKYRYAGVYYWNANPILDTFRKDRDSGEESRNGDTALFLAYYIYVRSKTSFVFNYRPMMMISFRPFSQRRRGVPVAVRLHTAHLKYPLVAQGNWTRAHYTYTRDAFATNLRIHLPTQRPK